MRHTRFVCALSISVVSMIAIVGCGAVGSPSSSATSRSTTPSQVAFAEQWPARSPPGAAHSRPVPFEVPGTVLGTSQGDAPVELVASGDTVIGVRQTAVDDAFHIGSMTKLFTAALIMQLDQEGVLSIGDTIDKWFPAAPNGSKIRRGRGPGDVECALE